MVGTGILSNLTIWGHPLPIVTRHSGWWPYTVTPSIDQALHQLLTLFLNWTLSPKLTLYLEKNIFNGCGMPTEDAYSRHLVLSQFGTLKWSYVKTNLSWTCLVSGLWVSNIPRFFCFACIFHALKGNSRRAEKEENSNWKDDVAAATSGRLPKYKSKPHYSHEGTLYGLTSCILE